MRKEYLCDFFALYDYPQEAREALFEAYGKILENEACKASFEGFLKAYEEQMRCDFGACLEGMKKVSEMAGIHEYTGYILLIMGWSEILRGYYKKENVADKIWITTMNDIKYKLIECKLVHDVWGTFSPAWYPGFMRMTRFGFGKLQFEQMRFGVYGDEYEKDGVHIGPDDTVINIHIPRTGGKLDHEGVLKAYDEAAAFFRERYGMERIVFVCRSWLLFKRHKEVLKPTANLCQFMDDFDLILEGEYDDYSQIWRLFGVMYDGNVDRLPQDSSLRRTYAEWVRKGQRLGWSFGVRIYQGEN